MMVACQDTGCPACRLQIGEDNAACPLQWVRVEFWYKSRRFYDATFEYPREHVTHSTAYRYRPFSFASLCCVIYFAREEKEWLMWNLLRRQRRACRNQAVTTLINHLRANCQLKVSGKLNLGPYTWEAEDPNSKWQPYPNHAFYCFSRYITLKMTLALLYWIMFTCQDTEVTCM